MVVDLTLQCLKASSTCDGSNAAKKAVRQHSMLLLTIVKRQGKLIWARPQSQQHL
jgi:hypothetical protein